MTLDTTVLAGDGYDASPDFVYAVSLLAALESMPATTGHAVGPLLGMARAELTDFGQRRPAHFVEVPITNWHGAMTELEQRLTQLVVDSQTLQHTLRVEAALRLLRRGLVAA